MDNNQRPDGSPPERDGRPEERNAATDEHPTDGGATAERIVDDIRDRVSSLRPQAAAGVEHAADAARQAAGSLRGDEAWLAQIVEQGADKLSGLAQTLRTNDLQTLLSKTEQFARQQPVLFAGAAMALGFALTRAAASAARDTAS